MDKVSYDGWGGKYHSLLSIYISGVLLSGSTLQRVLAFLSFPVMIFVTLSNFSNSEFYWNIVMRVAELSYALGLAMLGFLIAGYAIFAGLGSRSALRKLAQTPWVPDYSSRLERWIVNFLPEKSWSYFEYINLSFLVTFIEFLFMTIAVLLILIIQPGSSDLSYAISKLINANLFWYNLLSCLTLSLSVTLLILCLVSLKDFVYNCFAVFSLMARI
jgi:hypothetical protein